ncbi:MAG: metal-sulfur cluster assembly factor [Streptosporangiaceae bacterium]
MNGSPARSGPHPAGQPDTGTGLVYAVNAAWNALTYVYDPELYLDVVSLGLIYDVRSENGAIVVEMTLTTPGCPAPETLPEMARAAVTEAVTEARPVEVRVVWDPPWSPAMIDDTAAEALGFRIR